MKKAALFLLLGFLAIPSRAEEYGAEKFPVHEGLFALTVTVKSVLSPEITNETQAKALARDAAVAVGQINLLKRVLEKKASSRKTLAEAEIPSIALQQQIRGYIKGAKITRTKWEGQYCYVTLSLDKSELKQILKKN